MRSKGASQSKELRRTTSEKEVASGFFGGTPRRKVGRNSLTKYVPGLRASLEESDAPGKYTMVTAELKSTNASKELLLDQAIVDLRCVEASQLTLELFESSVGSDATYQLSRQAKPGEIDCFVSHSWHDDAETKYEALMAYCAKFRRRYNRDPTFWIDKICIDQRNIGDGLRKLPVNIMACHQILALCGETYASRLWCIWELYTTFAFRPSVAAEMIQVIDVTAPEATFGQINPTTPQSLGARLSTFDFMESHCYDPNEEAKIRSCIQANGTLGFNMCVRQLGQDLEAAAQAASLAAAAKTSPETRKFGRLASRFTSLADVRSAKNNFSSYELDEDSVAGSSTTSTPRSSTPRSTVRTLGSSSSTASAASQSGIIGASGRWARANAGVPAGARGANQKLSRSASAGVSSSGDADDESESSKERHSIAIPEDASSDRGGMGSPIDLLGRKFFSFAGRRNTDGAKSSSGVKDLEAAEEAAGESGAAALAKKTRPCGRSGKGRSEAAWG